VNLPLAQFRQLVKVMALTTSPSDAEALAAVRRANAVLAAANLTWPDVLNRVVTVEQPLEQVLNGHGRTPDAEELLGEAETLDLRQGHADFVATLRERYDARGHLTTNELSALRQLLQARRPRP
jgi:hypothetical protein